MLCKSRPRHAGVIQPWLDCNPTDLGSLFSAKKGKRNTLPNIEKPVNKASLCRFATMLYEFIILTYLNNVSVFSIFFLCLFLALLGQLSTPVQRHAAVMCNSCQHRHGVLGQVGQVGQVKSHSSPCTKIWCITKTVKITIHIIHTYNIYIIYIYILYYIYIY